MRRAVLLLCASLLPWPLAGQDEAEGIHWSFIRHHEGMRLNSYVLPPTRFPNSGVTIAMGFDLGQWTPETMRLLLDLETVLGRQTFEALARFASPNLRGQAARDAHREHGPVRLTQSQADALTDALGTWYESRMADLYNRYNEDSTSVRWLEVPSPIRTAIVSYAWQWGPRFFEDNRGDWLEQRQTYWRHLTRQDWPAAIEWLEMASEANDQFKKRRLLESYLMRYAIANRQPATVTGDGLNVRLEGSGAGLVIGELDRNDQVQVIAFSERRQRIGSHNAHWVLVSPVGDLSSPGWVYGGYLCLPTGGDCDGRLTCCDPEASCESGFCRGVSSLRFTLTWEADTDLDLYLSTPAQNPINFRVPVFDRGQLIQDSCVGSVCLETADDHRESVVFYALPSSDPAWQPPSGVYRVWAENADGRQETSFAITVYEGESPSETLQGWLPAEAGASSDTLVFPYRVDPAQVLVCDDECPYANDGQCDDGGSDSVLDVCAWGTDCSDCGPRVRAEGAQVQP